jgi:hypothetical protein
MIRSCCQKHDDSIAYATNPASVLFKYMTMVLLLYYIILY